MKKKIAALLSLLMVSAVILPLLIKPVSSTPARSAPPIVSTAWLNANLRLTNLVVLDIRSPDLYNAGHIPGAINVPDYLWYANPPFGEKAPWMEMPPEDYLFELIGNASITRDSIVVVVGGTSGPLAPIPLALYSTAGITRVAITLLYAGIENVCILDGGYDKWVADRYSTETTPRMPTPKTYSGTVKKGMIVSKQYVASKVGQSIIVDSRDAEVYLGFIQEPWTARVGHIPTARSFPTPWLWNLNLNATGTGVNYATYKDVNVLETFANCIIGADKTKEIIIYCGVGGYASTMYFVLSEVLNYKDVKIYDGSAQEWTADLQLPVAYEGLGSEYMELQTDHNELQSRYNALQNSYNSLQRNYDELQGSYRSLQADYDELAKSTTPAYWTWTFVVTTIIFVLLTVWFAIKSRAKKVQ
ncbi:MAG: rhodanese-like domain-containing protein [Candidatus Bathyarchaeota archaeon]|nr:rhodanese-like domain-containing protein [Candidatus Bathyarchaeota archaeon]